MPIAKSAALLALRDALLDLEASAAAAEGRLYSRRSVARRLAPGDPAQQRRWNNRLHRWLNEGQGLVCPEDFQTLWPLVEELSSTAGVAPDREHWQSIHAAAAGLAGVDVGTGDQSHTPSAPVSSPVSSPMLSPAPPPASSSAPTLIGRRALVVAGVGATAAVVAPTLWKRAVRRRTPPRSPEWLASAPVRRLTGAAQQLMAVRFRPDGQELAAVGGDGVVFFWTPGAITPSGSVALSAESLFALAYSPDGTTVVTGGMAGQVVAVSDRSRSIVRSFTPEDAVVAGLDISPDGRTVAIGTSQPGVRIRDLGTGAELHTIKINQVRHTKHGHLRPAVGGVGFSPDNKLLATVGPDDLVRIWNTTTWRLERTLPGHRDLINKLAWSADGRQLATGADDLRAIVWDTTTWQATHDLAGHGGGVWGLAFSPDGRQLATACMDRLARVWDLDTNAPRLLEAGAGHVWDVAIDPGGRVVTSSHEDDTSLRLWPLDT